MSFYPEQPLTVVKLWESNMIHCSAYLIAYNNCLEFITELYGNSFILGARLDCTFGPSGHGPPNNWRNFTRARTRIGHVANFARAILANSGKLARAHTWLSTMSQFHMRVIWANSHMRIRDYWPCREFARAWFGLTRACTYATIDNVVNSHALDLSKLVSAYATWPCR